MTIAKFSSSYFENRIFKKGRNCMKTPNQSVLTLSPLTGCNAGLLKAACRYIEPAPCEPLSSSVNLTVIEPLIPWELPDMGIFFISLSHSQAWCPCAFPTATTDSEEQRVYNHTHSPLFPISHRAGGTDGSEKSFTRYCTFHTPEKKTLSVRSSQPITLLKSPATASRSAGDRRKLGY